MSSPDINIVHPDIEKYLDAITPERDDILRESEGEFDIIFNDIGKRNYPNAPAMSIPKLGNGGLFITDNVLWSGRISDDNPDEATAGVLSSTACSISLPDPFTTIIPLRDGVSVSIKR